jgi:hemoglobin
MAMHQPLARDPHPKAPGLAVGIDEALIAQVVASFYGMVRRDPALGPIFESRIADWDAHLEKLTRFWSSVTLLTGAYKGTPMQAHLSLPGVEDVHYAIWLRLFDVALARHCTPAQAEIFRSRAVRMAASFRLAGRSGTRLEAVTSG